MSPGAGRSAADARAFFAPRAATWDDRFPDDGPAFDRAVAGLELASGATVLDAGCGSGRALPALRAAVGPAGYVVGVDVTPEMVTAARDRGRERAAALIVADAGALPVDRGGADAVFAAGLFGHVVDPAAVLGELARTVRPGGVLGLFHPVGRAALAQRHGRALSPDDRLDARNLPGVLARAGWELEELEDGSTRFWARARRAGEAPG